MIQNKNIKDVPTEIWLERSIQKDNSNTNIANQYFETQSRNKQEIRYVREDLIISPQIKVIDGEISKASIIMSSIPFAPIILFSNKDKPAVKIDFYNEKELLLRTIHEEKITEINVLHTFGGENKIDEQELLAQAIFDVNAISSKNENITHPVQVNKKTQSKRNAHPKDVYKNHPNRIGKRNK